MFRFLYSPRDRLIWSLLSTPSDCAVRSAGAPGVPGLDCEGCDRDFRKPSMSAEVVDKTRPQPTFRLFHAQDPNTSRSFRKEFAGKFSTLLRADVMHRHHDRSEEHTSDIQ